MRARPRGRDCPQPSQQACLDAGPPAVARDVSVQAAICAGKDAAGSGRQLPCTAAGSGARMRSVGRAAAADPAADPCPALPARASAARPTPAEAPLLSPPPAASSAAAASAARTAAPGRLVDDRSGAPLSNVHSACPVCLSRATSLPLARETSRVRSRLQHRGPGKEGHGRSRVGRPSGAGSRQRSVQGPAAHLRAGVASRVSWSPPTSRWAACRPAGAPASRASSRSRGAARRPLAAGRIMPWRSWRAAGCRAMRCEAARALGTKSAPAAAARICLLPKFKQQVRRAHSALPSSPSALPQLCWGCPCAPATRLRSAAQSCVCTLSPASPGPPHATQPRPGHARRQP